jgi:hypothetical protein
MSFKRLKRFQWQAEQTFLFIGKLRSRQIRYRITCRLQDSIFFQMTCVTRSWSLAKLRNTRYKWCTPSLSIKVFHSLSVSHGFAVHVSAIRVTLTRKVRYITSLCSNSSLRYHELTNTNSSYSVNTFDFFKHTERYAMYESRPLSVRLAFVCVPLSGPQLLETENSSVFIIT